MFSRSFRTTSGHALLVAALLAAFSGVARADSTLDRIHQRHKIAIGVILSGPPFGSLDPATQKPVGFNVDLANDVAKRLGVDVELTPVQPSNRVQFLQQGKVDALIANMELTTERAEILSYAPTPSASSFVGLSPMIVAAIAFVIGVMLIVCVPAVALSATSVACESATLP